jgi:hypothetical protein
MLFEFSNGEDWDVHPGVNHRSKARDSLCSPSGDRLRAPEFRGGTNLRRKRPREPFHAGGRVLYSRSTFRSTDVLRALRNR